MPADQHQWRLRCLSHFIDAYEQPTAGPGADNRNAVISTCEGLIYSEIEEYFDALDDLSRSFGLAHAEKEQRTALAHWAQEGVDVEYTCAYAIIALQLDAPDPDEVTPGSVIDCVERLVNAFDFLRKTTPGSTGEMVERNKLAYALVALIAAMHRTLREYRIHDEVFFEAVHEANLRKRWPDGRVHRNELGKVLKPADWVAPDWVAVLSRALVPDPVER
ncbi:hypothetical protein FDA94_28555 [Herbidospora galbida]|uniref:Uncharacterized protein n=1 Tax=Herbidospora galbida TaxID=2575442 RepID=A0A4V5UYS1_9ACTN|nr:hypothetical protein [Herbidospora galbida]TKK84583.1 hypothetical protein FDA94_28555 [Herbidospora galbida]